jgi:hypothetical protein
MVLLGFKTQQNGSRAHLLDLSLRDIPNSESFFVHFCSKYYKYKFRGDIGIGNSKGNLI